MNHATVPELRSDLAAIMAQTVGDRMALHKICRLGLMRSSRGLDKPIKACALARTMWHKQQGTNLCVITSHANSIGLSRGEKVNQHGTRRCCSRFWIKGIILKRNV